MTPVETFVWEGLTPPYSTIVADPPWDPPMLGGSRDVRKRTQHLARPQAQYSTLSVDQIASLPVATLVDGPSHLWLWVINQHIDWGYEVARAWGFEPQQMVTWAKPRPGVGRFQSNTEHALVCRKGRLSFGHIGGTWYQWTRGRHSVKPAAFFDLVEQVSPGPYVELFARQPRLGWDSWGYGYRTPLLAEEPK